MTLIIPPKRPQQSKEDTLRAIKTSGVDESVALLGVRGYYRDSLGIPGKNDRGIYDDAIFLVSPESYVTFNANTDPSVFRPNVAMLLAGVYRYKLGIHGLSKPKAKQYKALVQAAKVTVARDDNDDPDGAPQIESGFFGINVHKGSRTSTSSEGCQTIWPDQWPSFIALVEAEMKRNNQTTIPYVLVDYVS